MKIIREYKLSNGEIIKEYKVKHEWNNNCSRYTLYDENSKFIRYIKKKEVYDYIDYVEFLKEIENFKKWREKKHE